MDNQTLKDKAALLDAWDAMMGDLQKARDIIDSTEHFAPEATSRVLAEGYRYLAGFIHHGLERSFFEDPQYPAFRNALSIFNKSTIDNSDAIYFYAPIDGSKRYLVKGKLGDSSHWRGEPRPSEGRLAPQYLIFEMIKGPISGDTGELSELMPGVRVGFGSLDCSEIIVDGNGEFELLVAPEKPDGYTGNFMCSHRVSKKGDEHYATYISGRQLFYDWEREDSVTLTITALDNVGDHPPALTPQVAADNLRTMGSVIHGQMKFWLEFYDVVLNCNGTHENVNNSPYFMPVNGYNQVNSASGDTGGGMSTNIYAGGIYDLAEDEALYVEARFTGEPNYSSMHLGNLWGESPDFANHQSSLNLHQMYMGGDNVQRWVVAHSDPGVQNWIDTTGLPKGYLSHRWAYSELPEKKDWPVISAKKIRLDEVRASFPDDMPILSLEERKEVIRIRQQHVQRRYRSF